MYPGAQTWIHTKKVFPSFSGGLWILLAGNFSSLWTNTTVFFCKKRGKKKALLMNYTLLAVLLKCSNKILLSAAQA